MSALTDFNDLATAASLAEVRRQVDQAVPTIAPPQWPEPTLPGTAPTPAINADVLATWAQDMVEAVVVSTQTPPALGVMVCLSVLATVFQGRYEVEPLPGYKEPLSLWGTPIDTVDKVDRPKTQTESLSRLSTLSYGVDARGRQVLPPHQGTVQRCRLRVICSA